LLFTINWLTIVSDPLLKTLGGKEEVARRLGPTCPMHSYDGGAILQAGPRPQLGDVNRGIDMEPYRRVSNILKPVRFKNYRRGIFQFDGDAFDSLEETHRWLQRFET
jgi:hypothetical protein